MQAVAGRSDEQSGIVHDRRRSRKIDRPLGLERQFRVPPGRPPGQGDLQRRRDPLRLEQRGRRRLRPRDRHAAAGLSGQPYLAQVEQFGRFGDQPVEVERPRERRRPGVAGQRDLGGPRRQPRILDPQPIALTGPPAAADPAAERLLPAERAFPDRAGRVGIRSSGDEALHGGQIAGCEPQFEHPVVAVRPRGGREVKLTSGDADIGPHGQPAGKRPRQRGEVDRGRDREIFLDEAVGPFPGARAGQPDPTRRFGPEERGGGRERADDEPVADERAIDRDVARLQRCDRPPRGGIAGRDRRGDERPGDPGLQIGGDDIATEVGRALEEVRESQPRRQHARPAERQPMSGDRDPSAPVGTLRGRTRKAPRAGEDRRGTGGDRAPIQSRDLGIGGRRARVRDRLRARGGPHEPAGHRPAGERRVGPTPACRHQPCDPPGLAAHGVAHLDRAVHEFDLEGRRRPHRGPGQPRCQDVLDRTAAGTDIHQHLGADQPHRPQVVRIGRQREQAAVDDEPGHHRHGPSLPVAEHDVPVFDPAAPAPDRRAARHAAVDARQRRGQGAVAQVGMHRHGRRHGDGRRRDGEKREGEHRPAPGPPAARASVLVSGTSPRHGGGV